MVEGSVEKLIPAILTARVCGVTTQVRMIVGLGLKKKKRGIKTEGSLKVL